LNVELERLKWFNAKEISEIRKIILENLKLFKTKWDERFANN